MCFCKRQKLIDAIDRLTAAIEGMNGSADHEERIERLEAQMSDIATSVKDVTDAETALEARVTAHEQHEADIAAGLQTQIDALTAKLGADDQAVKDLVALKAKMDAFDATAPAPPAP